jgi:polyhydroxybutyrate depolymerase
MMLRLAALLALLAAPAHAGCGPDPAPCAIPEGSYHVALPEGAASLVPAVMFLHGYGASGAAMMGMGGIADTITARGYAFIAPDGLSRPGRGAGWSFRPGDAALRDEPAFFAAVKADAARRFGLNPDAMILSGFSIGGSMTHYAACKHPDAFAAYAPVAGAFWRPHPEACTTSPMRLFHTHGWTDSTVPLEGRPLRGGAIRQGDTFASLDIWRAAMGCTYGAADQFETTGPFLRRRWTRCAEGSTLEFALHPGSHSVPPGWATMMLDWFEALPPPKA